eukprot:UN02628
MLLKRVNCGVWQHYQCETDLHSIAFLPNFIVLEKRLVPEQGYDTISENDWFRIALRHGTDKAKEHRYHQLYEKYLPQFKRLDFTMLEIGLGCRMSYGPGASCNVWKEYFPSAEVHMLEFDFECYQKWKETERLRNVTVHIGDQGDA